MDDDATSSRPLHIDAAELDRVEVAADGRRLCLRMRDHAGRAASLSLPVECLAAVLAAVPRAGGQTGRVHRLESWSLDQGGPGLVLTLHAPDGAKVAFAVQPWQIAAIASLAGIGASRPGRLN